MALTTTAEEAAYRALIDAMHAHLEARPLGDAEAAQKWAQALKTMALRLVVLGNALPFEEH